jgi:hypothetical protein
MSTLINDIKFAFRQLRKSPCFTAVAIVSLALGIGANTAVFSLINGVLFKTLPVHDPEQLRVICWSGSDVSMKRYSGSGKRLASGLYCKVTERIPIMTKVQVVLSLPGKTEKSPRKDMDIDGIVVREHPVKKDGRVTHYDVAIFFNTLMPRERETLVKYISKKSG